jgi:2-methylisocitrate lyase-like PEP mutase family enzyme
MPVSVEEVRAFALGLPRTTEGVVRGRLKFRVGRIVYVDFSRDETIMGFAFPKEWRETLVESEPEKFVMPTGGDLRYNWVQVRLAAIDVIEMRELVLDAWAMVVPKSVAAAYEVSMQPSQAEKAAAFSALHDGDPFIIPNPWDAGSAKVLAGLGFRALAGTSSGFAFTRGRLDGDVGLDDVLAHIRQLDEATPLPVSMDLENGYGPAPSDAARAIEEAAAAGAVGGSIEDWDPEGHLYAPASATERVAAAVEAARGLDFPFTLTARAENHIRGNPDLDDTIARLQAYEGAGADVLYAPGLRTADEVRAVCSAVSRPVNVLAHRGLTMAEIVEAGGQRVSVGGALTWVAARAMAAAAEQMRDSGDFSGLTGPGPIGEWLQPR